MSYKKGKRMWIDADVCHDLGVKWNLNKNQIKNNILII